MVLFFNNMHVLGIFKIGNLLNYLKGRVTERDKSSIHSSTLQMTTTAAAGPDLSQEPEIPSVTLLGGRDPSTWGIFCFPTCISRKLGWKQNSRDLNRCPYGMSKPGAETHPDSGSSVCGLSYWAGHLGRGCP